MFSARTSRDRQHQQDQLGAALTAAGIHVEHQHGEEDQAEDGERVGRDRLGRAASSGSGGACADGHASPRPRPGRDGASAIADSVVSVEVSASTELQFGRAESLPQNGVSTLYRPLGVVPIIQLQGTRSSRKSRPVDTKGTLQQSQEGSAAKSF